MIRQRRPVNPGTGIYMEMEDGEKEKEFRGEKSRAFGSSLTKLLLLISVVGMGVSTYQYYEIINLKNQQTENYMWEELEAERKNVADCRTEIDEIETVLKIYIEELERRGVVVAQLGGETPPTPHPPRPTRPGNEGEEEGYQEPGQGDQQEEEGEQNRDDEAERQEIENQARIQEALLQEQTREQRLREQQENEQKEREIREEQEREQQARKDQETKKKTRTGTTSSKKTNKKKGKLEKNRSGSSKQEKT